jgi:hypothetical protein
METTVKICSAVHIDVQCERNDAEGIADGGPIMLGYSFYVPKDEKLSEYKQHIRECLTRYNRPFINMVITTKERFNPKFINTMKDIEDTIKLESI